MRCRGKSSLPLLTPAFQALRQYIRIARSHNVQDDLHCHPFLFTFLFTLFHTGRFPLINYTQNPILHNLSVFILLCAGSPQCSCFNNLNHSRAVCASCSCSHILFHLPTIHPAIDTWDKAACLSVFAYNALVFSAISQLVYVFTPCANLDFAFHILHLLSLTPNESPSCTVSG